MLCSSLVVASEFVVVFMEINPSFVDSALCLSTDIHINYDDASILSSIDNE